MRSYTNKKLPGVTSSTNRSFKRKFNGKSKSFTYGGNKYKKDMQQDMEIKRIKKQLKVIAPPVKSNYSEATYNPQNAWTGLGVPFPAKGEEPNERIGDEIVIKSVNVRYNLSVSESDTFDTMRVVFVQWNQPNTEGNLPVGQDALLWLDPSMDYPYNSPYNTQTASTYKVLFDKVYNLNDAGISQAHENLVFLPKDLKTTKLKFGTDVGTALPQLDGGLIVGYVCSDSTASPNPGINISVKLNYTDS